MKRLNFIVLVIISLFLSSCGLVAPFVPPIEAGDALGVENQVVSLAMATDSSASGSYIAKGEYQRSFEDSSDLDLKGFSVQDFRATVSIDKKLFLSASSKSSDTTTVAKFPKALKLVDVSVTARLEDDKHGMVSMAVKKDLGLEYKLDESSCKNGKCSYVSTESSESLSFVLSNSDAAELRKLIEIIKEENGISSTNKGYVKIEMKVKSADGLDGYSMDITLHSKGTKIKLGG